MRLVVRCEDGYGDWTLIELQGEVLSDTHDTLAGLELGKFTILDDKAENVTLTIGNHCLEGKRMKLKKPFAVLHKSADSDDPSKWGIAGVIRYKYLFKNRPKPA